MANKDALRELQTRLASRLQAAKTQPRARGWLAVECAGAGLLFPLAQAGEIFPLRALLKLPHAKPWMTGVAQLRGDRDLGRRGSHPSLTGLPLGGQRREERASRHFFQLARPAAASLMRLSITSALPSRIADSNL